MEKNLESLNLAELNSLLKAAKKQRTILAKRIPIGSARKKVTAVALKAGYTIEELFGGQATSKGTTSKAPRRKATSKVEPKYQNPENKRETWTGRGRMPRWLAEKTKFGRSPMDFLIPGLAKPTAAHVQDIGKRQVVKAEEA